MLERGQCKEVEISNTYCTVFISVINQLDAQNFCFTISLFHTSTCFERMCSSSGASSWLITEINILRCTVSKTSRHALLFCFNWVGYTNMWQYNTILGWTHGAYETDVTCIHFISPSTAEN